jgi:cysteinyl-tRNA synthetase
MDWTAEKAEQAKATLRNWRALVLGADEAGPDQDIVDLIADDLNTAGAITKLHAMAKAITANPQKDCFYEKGAFLSSARLLGLLSEELGGWETGGADLAPFEAALSALRDAAMQTKDFSAVDAMKAALISAGVEVRMSKAGVELAEAAGFDASKLEGLLE